MRCVMLASLLAIAIAACADSPIHDPGLARSGTRLVLHRFVYEGGGDEIDRRWFYDLGRDERCAPEEWFDDVTRCTPEAAEGVYVTSECSQLHARVPTGRAAPVYGVRRSWFDPRGLPSQLYRVLGPTRAFEQAWELRDGFCIGPYDGTGFDYYTLGEEVERGALARISTPELARGSHLALSAYTSSDGLHVPFAARDLALDVACTLERRPGANATSCAPDGATPARYFQDATCDQLAIAVPPDQLPPEHVSYHDEQTGCTTYHALGDEIEAPPLYHQIGGSCVDVAAPRAAFRGAGPALELPSLERTVEPGDERIRPILVHDGALLLRDTLVHDSELGVDCRRVQIDDEHHCLPAATAPLIPVFTDATCQRAISIALLRDGGCHPEVRFAHTDGQILHAIGAPYAGELFHISTGEHCVPYGVRADHVAYTVGPALPLSTFARAEPVLR